MAVRSVSVFASIENPLVTILAALLFLVPFGFVANIYFVEKQAHRKEGYVHYANQLKMVSQKIAKHANSAARGNLGAFSFLGESVQDFETYLSYLEDGNPIADLGPAPAGTRDEIDAIRDVGLVLRENSRLVLGSEDALNDLKDMSEDLAITVQDMQTENSKVVARMLGTSAASGEVVRAQRQELFIEKVAHGINMVMELGSTKTLVDTFNRDGRRFKQVLDGLLNSDRGLRLTAIRDPQAATSLRQIDAYYRSVEGKIKEIVTRSEELQKVRNAADQVDKNSERIVEAADAFIDKYKQLSDAEIASPMSGKILAAFGVLVFIATGFLIYRETNSSLVAAAIQSEQDQQAILRLLDELTDLADGDLRVQASVTESFTGAIADSINFSIDQMRVLVSQINKTSGLVSRAADETQASVTNLAEASQRQASEIADVSRSVNEMAVSIDKVTLNAAESSSVAERSVDIANKGAEVVQNTIDGMGKIRGQIQETAKRIKRLGESSQEIGDIVSLINDIADQTNILSLNAAIQASMAGDAGRGFAVVADEVQRLAERSGGAAKQISALIKTIQSDTNEAVASMEITTVEVVQGTKLAQDAGVALEEIEGVSKTLAEVIENISDAAREQSVSAGKIANTMKSIQKITSQTTEGTKASAAAVGNLAKMSNELRSSVSGFKLPEDEIPV